MLLLSEKNVVSHYLKGVVCNKKHIAYCVELSSDTYIIVFTY